jgi:hypothetical protein
MTRENVLFEYGDKLNDYVEKWKKETSLPKMEVQLICPKLWSPEHKDLWEFLTEPLSSEKCLSELAGVCVYSFSRPQEKLILLLTNHLKELASLTQDAARWFILEVMKDYPPGVYAYPSCRIRKTGEKWVPISAAPDSSIWHPRLGKARGNWFYEFSLSELAPLKIEIIHGGEE